MSHSLITIWVQAGFFYSLLNTHAFPLHSTPHKAILKTLVSLSGSSKGWLSQGTRRQGRVKCQDPDKVSTNTSLSFFFFFFSEISWLFLKVICIWEIDCAENSCSVMCSFHSFQTKKKNLNIWDTCGTESVIYFKVEELSQQSLTGRALSNLFSIGSDLWLVSHFQLDPNSVAFIHGGSLITRRDEKSTGCWV